MDHSLMDMVVRLAAKYMRKESDFPRTEKMSKKDGLNNAALFYMNVGKAHAWDKGISSLLPIIFGVLFCLQLPLMIFLIYKANWLAVTTGMTAAMTGADFIPRMLLLRKRWFCRKELLWVYRPNEQFWKVRSLNRFGWLGRGGWVVYDLDPEMKEWCKQTLTVMPYLVPLRWHKESGGKNSDPVLINFGSNEDMALFKMQWGFNA